MNNTTIPTISYPTQQPSLPSGFKLLDWAFSFFKQHASLIIGICAILFILDIIDMLIETLMPEKNLPNLVIIILAIITFVINLLSYLALFDAIVEERQSIKSISGAYRKSLSMFFPSIWVSILIMLTGFGGFFLFIIPGILLTIWLSLSLFVLFAENRRGISALVASWYYVKGYWGAVFWRVLFFIIILISLSLIVGIILLIVGIILGILAAKSGMGPEISFFSQVLVLIFNNFFILPLSIIYFYGIYKSLKKIKTLVPLESDEQKIKRYIMIFLIIGIIGSILYILAFFKSFTLLMKKFFLQSPNLKSVPSF